VADAVAVDARGQPYLVIDWKSDVDPGEEVVAGYREQVRDYLRLTGVQRGLLVFLTSGRVEEVRAAERARHGILPARFGFGQTGAPFRPDLRPRFRGSTGYQPGLMLGTDVRSLGLRFSGRRADPH
jgi:hypothetical protein